jgi:hypothetical protein
MSICYHHNRSGISQDPGHQQTKTEGRGRSASAQKKQVRNQRKILKSKGGMEILPRRKGSAQI